MEREEKQAQQEGAEGGWIERLVKQGQSGRMKRAGLEPHI